MLPNIDFLEIKNSLSSFPWRAHLQVTEIPAPRGVADDACAVEADVVSNLNIIGDGRLVLLYDAAGNDMWRNKLRCVAFIRADIDMDIAADPLLPDVGWTWLTECLNNHNADFHSESGTVTVTASRSHGGRRNVDEASIEIRASWSPNISASHGIISHFMAWQDLLCLAAGLPPIPAGIDFIGAPLAARRYR